MPPSRTSPAATPPAATPPGVAPSGVPPARTSRRARLAAWLAPLADRWWRPLLTMAALLFALSGPAHAFGLVDAVFYAALIAVALGAVAVPLGLLGLLADRSPHSHPRRQPYSQEPS